MRHLRSLMQVTLAAQISTGYPQGGESMSDLSDLSRMSDLSQPSTGRVAGSDGRKKKKCYSVKGSAFIKKF